MNHDPAQLEEENRRLKEENASLQKRLAEMEADKEAYLQRAVRSLARQMLTEEVVRGWMSEEKVEGTMIDFINEAKREILS